ERKSSGSAESFGVPVSESSHIPLPSETLDTYALERWDESARPSEVTANERSPLEDFSSCSNLLIERTDMDMVDILRFFFTLSMTQLGQ
ncbi:7309_t:CDS:2, partial [Acaulospora colombiana]